MFPIRQLILMHPPFRHPHENYVSDLTRLPFQHPSISFPEVPLSTGTSYLGDHSPGACGSRFGRRGRQSTRLGCLLFPPFTLQNSAIYPPEARSVCPVCRVRHTYNHQCSASSTRLRSPLAQGSAPVL